MDRITDHSSPQTPTGGGTLDAVRHAIKNQQISTVLVAVPDMMGRLKGKRLDAQTFLDGLSSSRSGAPVMEACAYILATDVDMRPLPGFGLTGWEQGFQDIGVVPDLGTFRVLPYLPKTALVHGDAVHPGGTLVDVAPRHILRTQLDRLTDLGYELRAGLESEFVLYHARPWKRSRQLRPVTLHNLDYALDHPPALTGFFEPLEAALRGSGMPPESVKTEGARGQAEVTFLYGNPLEACDAHTVFKHATRHIAGQQGLVPTFMAAPETGVGSGLHLHVSLWQDGQPAFAVAASSHEELPDTLTQSIGGLIAALPDVVPLYAPTVNSYKRYSPHSFAPTAYNWGFDNRGCAVRVAGHGDGTHLEVRLPGADANPYLALAAVCAAISHGLQEKHDPPEPCSGDGYQDSTARPVPTSLDQAVADFEISHLARSLLGAGVVEHYAQAARIEAEAHRQQVTDVERERGLDCA